MDRIPRLGVKFWGVRGSTPTPVQGNLGFGGNTTCVEIQVPEQESIIIDSGTGVRELGFSLARKAQGGPLAVNILLTHFHWDHIQGLPFFAPLYSPANQVTFHSSHPEERVRDLLEGQMSAPYFPVSFDRLAAKRVFNYADPSSWKIGDVTIRGFPMHHPQTATGFRIERNGAVVVHASDLEHGDPKMDRILRDTAQGADVLLYDAQYTPEQYESKRGWGHSTWLEATRVANDAKVKQLVLCHHDPTHTDEQLSEICLLARREFANTEIAREGSLICL